MRALVALQDQDKSVDAIQKDIDSVPPRIAAVQADLANEKKRMDAAKARVTVRDRGPGVPEESLAHLFEPFYRVNDARDRDSGGAGLGLAITRQVVKAHGGNVSAVNCADGGLQLTIELPLKTPDGAARNGIRFRASA